MVTIKNLSCPSCKTSFSEGIRVYGEEVELPRVGDVAVCMNCGIVFKISKKLEILSDTEIKKLSENRTVWNAIINLQFKARMQRC
jgi:uncharacterized protein YbaR (Trm112 family)